MNTKAFTALLITAGCLTIAFLIARLTGALQFYAVPAESNAPAFYPGTHFFATNLRSPSRNGFICFRQNNPVYGAGVWFHRVIGMPGDTVEIRNGVAFVNGADADRQLQLMHEYCLTGSDAQSPPVQQLNLKNRLAYNSRERGGDSICYMWPDAAVAESGLGIRPFFRPANMPDSFIRQRYSRPWNVDQFGPVCVPAGHYFLLGDNRHSAMDSRYLGFIADKEVVGVILGK